jgi:hypothetical protein
MRRIVVDFADMNGFSRCVDTQSTVAGRSAPGRNSLAEGTVPA